MIENQTAMSKEVRHAREMARLVIEHHFGSCPRRVMHKASGLSNFVFEVNHKEGDFIVRISPEQARLNSFIKEQWAQAEARKIGVPTPEILEVGSDVIGQPFMISRVVEGSEATFHKERLKIIRQMGALAAMINTIPTNCFGSTFDWSSNQLSRNDTWKDFLEKELQADGKLQILEKRKMLDGAQIKKIRKILADTAKLKIKPKLNHGDIRLKNLMVDENGKITALLDWEHCTSNLAPHWELSLALHDLSIDEKQEFLEGYGLKEKEMLKVAPVVKAINIINYAPEIERLAQAKEKAKLEQYRTRLGGALDLYSL
jgi:aminoglycoside phosphotransferase (APT) family kinase protein